MMSHDCSDLRHGRRRRLRCGACLRARARACVRAFMAASTGEMLDPPLWQADPADAARSAASADRRRLALTCVVARMHVGMSGDGRG